LILWRLWEPENYEKKKKLEEPTWGGGKSEMAIGGEGLWYIHRTSKKKKPCKPGEKAWRGSPGSETSGKFKPTGEKENLRMTNRQS